MRIIAGRWRGRRLTALGKGDAGAHLRPTPDRVRESLFSMLTHRDVIAGARVLDLFAGTGALAFEALSRGAQSAVLIENGRVGQRLIAENIRLLGATEAHLKRMDATRLGPLEGAPFTLVFLDPPYGQGLGQKTLDAAHQYIAPGGTIVWEEKEIQVPPAGYAPLDQRQMGGSCITLLTRI
ncbi:MAG: 16S rRNA (guanine(966)-N(2))-methyltransferase RsmD [Pseudomonadota bacterium]